MHIVVDEDKCVAGGQCVFAAPEVFDQRDEDGIVVLLDEHVPVSSEEDVLTAISLCPAAAIRLAEQEAR
ncbi:ferredoxin [Rhodococcus sp. SC4]|uniref:ferredoxin n=1 Tax=unclassified Rhodococcus (in: high G+C Gram-positive bacteria) TaxID=192944 RepID=UPI00076A6644|nr:MULTISPECIES: ferredoxin [unclassified Rhodococcus (in: high G+C Gram-positive bacteria)]KXF53925.1 ferredoxin [Rhodococcus sp. SC4]KXX57470.1 ferredoxin [Rhodococcus sp. LB1]MDT2003837.1 ferredoxin [Rhodococcus opacus]PBC58240.1 ferredoxin [Rhodococcus sp. ACPA1]